MDVLDLAFPPEECDGVVAQTLHGPSLFAEGTYGALLVEEGVPIPVWGGAAAAAYYMGQVS